MQKLLMRVRNAHRVHGARMYTWLTCVLCTVLIAAMALTATGCQTAGGDQETGAQTSVESATVAITDSATEAETIPALGQGATTFTLAITFGDKTEKQYLIHTAGLTDMGMLFFQLFEGIMVGPVFPKLLLLDDVRLDREAETALLSLLPAFALGAVIVVTPLTQALVGAGQTRWFPLWLLGPFAHGNYP